MHLRSLIIALAATASLAACNIYFGDHTPPPPDLDAGSIIQDGSPIYPDGGSGWPDAWPIPPDGGSGCGCGSCGYPDAGGWDLDGGIVVPPDDGGIAVPPDAGWGWDQDAGVVPLDAGI